MKKGEIQYIKEGFILDKHFESKNPEQYNRCLTLLDVPLNELITRYVKSQTYGKGEKGGDILNDDYYDIPIILRDLFNLVTVQDVNKALFSIEERCEQIEAKMRNHRHELSKNFSAKPEF